MDDAGIEKIIVYATGWCPDCHRAKRLLEEHGVEYVNVDVDEDAAALAFVKLVNRGRARVPTIVFPDGQILVEPSNSALAAKLELEDTPDNFPGL